MPVSKKWLEDLRAIHKSMIKFKRLPYGFDHSGWYMIFRNNRPYVLNARDEDMTAMVYIAGGDYESAAKLISEEKLAGAISSIGEMIKLKEKCLELFLEMAMGLAQKDRKVINKQELRYAVVNSSELGKSLSARDVMEKI